MSGLNELLALAEKQVGYQEKRSNIALDDHDANAGRNNYTKYARDVNQWGLAGCQGQPWCATYQFWLEARTFGVDTALKHFHMKRKDYQGYHCFCIYDAFEKDGMTSAQPEVGSLIVFKHSHIGRVVDVRNGRVYTNEGNTSALYGDSNGGTVKEKDYSIGDPGILGYCLMEYGDKTGDGAVHKKVEDDLRIESFQCWLNTWYPKLLRQKCGGLLEEDGMYGPRTKQAAFTVWKDVVKRLYGQLLDVKETGFGTSCSQAAGKVLLRNGDTGTLVAITEGILAARGFYKGNVDAIFGEALDRAVREFQREHGLLVDGIIGEQTWKQLFK